MTVMVTPRLWYVVGMKLVMSYVKFPQAPFARAPFGECREKRIADFDRESSPGDGTLIFP